MTAVLCLSLFSNVCSYLLFFSLTSHAVITTYITAANSIHGQQVIAVAKLKLDHVLSRAQVTQLLLLRLAALLDQVLQQERIFAHPLDGLQQIGGQVHLVSELHLLILESDRE